MSNFTYEHFKKTCEIGAKLLGPEGRGKLIEVNFSKDTCVLETYGNVSRYPIEAIVNEICCNGTGYITNPTVLAKWKGWTKA